MGSTARLDRFLLLLAGLLLTAGGVFALLVGFGVFSNRLRHKPVFTNTVGTFFGNNGRWLWPVIAIILLLIGYLALRWLLAQLRPTGVRELQVEPDTTAGRTTVTGVAVTDAISHEIDSYRGVAAARARLTGTDSDPQLNLRVQLDDRADVTALRDRIETSAIAHARQALNAPQLPVRLDLVVTGKKAARVS